MRSGSDLCNFKLITIWLPENKLEHELKTILTNFRNKAHSEIKDGTYSVNVSPTEKAPVEVTKHSIENALKTICPTSTEKFALDLLVHFRELQRFIPFCSSPTSFHSAWDLREVELNKHTADRLVNEGAQLIPENAISERIFPHKDIRGIALGINKRLVAAVRHSKGNYDDRLSDLGVFTYQPDKTVPGMLRFRWCEYLSNKLNFSFMLIAVMWLRYEVIAGKNTKVFIIVPARIIRPEKNLKNLSSTLQEPLELQIMSRADIYSSLHVLESLYNSTLKIKIRVPLPQSYEEGWFFDEIHDSKKGKQIKKWFKENAKKCPGCGKLFSEFSDSDIAFGHIVSQDWATTFPHHLSSVHHPDNLYLTCKNCNSSLGNSFPNKNQTSQESIESEGTIGDWIRKTQL